MRVLRATAAVGDADAVGRLAADTGTAAATLGTAMARTRTGAAGVSGARAALTDAVT